MESRHIVYLQKQGPLFPSHKIFLKHGLCSENVQTLQLAQLNKFIYIVSIKFIEIIDSRIQYLNQDWALFER